MNRAQNVYCGKKVTGFRVGVARALAASAGLLLFAATARARPCDIHVGAGQTQSICSDQSADCIEVASGGTLEICCGTTLTLTGPGWSTVNGVVKLLGDGSELAFTTRSHTVYGSGSIDGFHDNAEISIAGGTTLTSAVAITGHLKIGGDGTFVNFAKVEADTSGTLLIDVGTLDDYPGADRWVVSTDAYARLRLNPTTQNYMAGEFWVVLGTIEIDTPLITTGKLDIDSGVFQVDADTTMGNNNNHLEFSGGEIVVASGVTFTHN